MKPSPVPARYPAGLPAALTTGTFRSRDCDEVRAHVGRMFCDHDMRMVNGRSALDTRTSRFDCRSLTFAEMGYGADVLINPGRLDGFYLIQVPLSGRAWVSVGGQQHACLPGMASIQDPELPIEMYWSADCRKIVLRYDRAALERFVEIYTGRPVSGALSLAPTVDLTRPEGAALAGLLDSIAALPLASAVDFSPLLKAHFESCFLSAMLLLQPGEAQAAFAQNDRHEPPRAVRLARDFLHAHAHEPIDLAELGLVSGVPLRTLHHQFRRALGTTPMQLLREIRLERVRAELLQATPGASVTSIALNWGFDHLGRFAASYRQRFGETPRETLQRMRAN